MRYRSGDEIRDGDHVLLHGQHGEIEFVLDGENNPEEWPVQKYGRGVMVREPKSFARLFLSETDIKDYEDLEFVSRSAGEDSK